METRTKVAAAAASVIPFSCVICFDEFNTKERPPMVLPCGHTYVCLPCTKRLKRCMECREPLFIKATSSNFNNNNHHHNNNNSSSNHNAHAASGGGGGAQGRYSPSGVHYHTASHHHQHHHQHQPHPTTPTKNPIPQVPTQRLPIPKNVVLLAMMEAAERQNMTVREERTEDLEDDDDDDSSGVAEDDSKEEQPQNNKRQQQQLDDDDEDEEAFNLDHIITGMATLSGPCGTYAVRDPDGLALYSFDPRTRTEEEEEEEEGHEQAVDLLVDPQQEQPPESVMMPSIPSESLNSLIDEEKKQDDDTNIVIQAVSADEQDEKVVSFSLPTTNRMESVEFLTKGQKIQVVSFDDGVAQLARGRGYVRATYQQLVKVGGPMDEACRLEGLLDSVRCRGEDLKKALEENDDIERKIEKQLQISQAIPPEHPVITEPPPPDVPAVAPATPETPSSPPVRNCLSTPEKNNSSTGAPEPFFTPSSAEFGTNRYAGSQPIHRPTPHSPASIDNSDIMMLPLNGPAMPRYGHSQSFEERENHLPLDLTFGCGVGLSMESDDDYVSRRTQPSSSAPNALRRGVPHFRSRPTETGLTPSLTSSFDGVDFRTGLSGHRGLSHARKHQHNSPKPRSQIRMMGEHRGISHVRAAARGGLANMGATVSSSSFGSGGSSPQRPYSAVPALGPRFSSPSS